MELHVFLFTLLAVNCIAQNTGDIRLFHGTDQSGVVQLYQSDSWKTVCGWGFLHTEASVACRQLGFFNGKALPLGAYGKITGTSSYSGALTRCPTGQEVRLTDCEFDENAECSEEDMAYASVNCYNTTSTEQESVKLESYSTEEPGYFAAVSVYGSEMWGRICANFWDDADARVVCRQLGYSGGIATFMNGDVSVPFLLSEINCAGNESSITACPYTTEFCYDTRSAAVVCSSGIDTGPSFTLVGGHTNNFGKVVVNIDGKQGLLCKSSYRGSSKVDISWKEAYPICKTMGFTSGSVISIDLDTPGLDTVVLEGVSCEGSEESVWECTTPNWKNTTQECEGQEAGVVLNCYTTVRLFNGLAVEAETYHMGRVEMHVDGAWYAVCADTFDETTASVTCSQLGYSSAMILTPDSFASKYSSTHVSNITCSGAESYLSNCSFTWGRCAVYNQHAAVLCTKPGADPNVRMSMSGPYYGEIDVKMYGVEGTVCMQGWDNTEARVACKAAGFQTGVILADRKQYSRYKPVWAFNFACTGTEASLEDCVYQTEFQSSDWACVEDLTSAGVLCFNSTPPEKLVRIQDGSRDSEGRVEVYSDETGWGTICNSGWSISDAKVLCRELGFPDGQSSSSGFSQASSDVPILLSGIQCDGDESSLFECANSGWTSVSSSCTSHQRDAGVYCYTHISLTPFRSYGAVQFHDGDNYGLVCADSFDQNAANVICLEMGFIYAKVVCCSAFGPRNEDFSMSALSCPTTARSISDCTFNSDNPSCVTGDYASVVCSNFTFGFTKITANPIVVVSYFLHDGYVCTENFTDQDATVLCRQQGSTYGYAYKTTFTGSQGIRWLQGLGCDGTEASFLDCDIPDWGRVGTCDIFAIAAVLCSNDKGDMDFNVRLEGGTDTAGRLEVYIKSTWGTVCGDDLTKSEAEVICRQLGYHDGIVMETGQYGAGSNPMLLSGLECKGHETSVKDCIWKGYAASSNPCQLSHTAAVKCFYKIRLSGSTTINYGRLEVFDDNENDWVAVCDRNQGVNEAMTLCRQMGYSDGIFQRGSALGPTDRNILITDIMCSSQSECTFTPGMCQSGKYIALYCSSTNIVNEDVDVRLPLSSFYGPVSIQRFGLWGHVCSVGFDDDDALVVCSDLGYKSGTALQTFATKGYPIIQGQMDCTGSEANTGDCSRTLFSAGHACYDINTVAGVLCYNGDGVTVVSTPLNPELGLMRSYAELDVDGVELRFDLAHFNDTDAAIYCNTLAYAGGTVVKQGYGSYGVFEMGCYGNEESILQCPAVWDPSITQNQVGDLAGVTCFTAVRLVGGDPALYGAVYTSKGINTGPVCSAGFDDVDSDVACRSLGKEHGLVLCCKPVGTLEDAGIFTNVQCTGEEKQFTECNHDNADQSHALACKEDYAAVACYDGPKPMDFILRIGGPSTYTGPLVVNYIGIDGRVCMDNWDDKDAHVACRQLGFTRGVAYRATRSENSAPFWTSNVECDGSESRLSDCPMTELGKVTQCSDTLSQAGVICYNNEGIYYRLGGSGEYRYGRVEVSLNGEWRSLCNLYWESQDTQVLCKMLGFRTGDAYRGNLIDEFRGPVWEVNFMCDGSEASLNLCRSSGWRVSTVPACALHQNDAAAFCYKSVKLSTGVGRMTDQGAVLLYYNDQWYTICNKGFNHESARVVCRELGFVDGQMQLGTMYGALLDYPRLNTHTVKCGGDETDVTDCLVEEPCDAQDYVSVVCYGFTLTTERQTQAPTKEDSFNALVPVIVAVVLFIVLVIVAIIVAYCIYKRRQMKKLNESKVIADTSTIAVNRDGSVEVSNRLHGLMETPESQRVRYTNRGEREEQVNFDATYLNPTYRGRANGEPRDTIHTYDVPHFQDEQGTHYDNLRFSQQEEDPGVRRREKKEDVVEKDDDMHTSFYISPFATQGVLATPTDTIDGVHDTV